MKRGTEYWLTTSEYDFDTANDMLKSGRYVYVVLRNSANGCDP